MTLTYTTKVMAPVPKETNKPLDENNMDESGAESLHNPNLVMTMAGGNSDSSDEDNEDMVAPGGYSLLPSEPGNYQDDSDSDAELDEETVSSLNLQNDSHALEGASSAIDSEIIPDAVLSSEAESCSPTAHISDDVNNPVAREKYPHGKIPSYLHVRENFLIT